jgi:hypothetical protein
MTVRGKMQSNSISTALWLTIIQELQQLSQQGYRLQALADSSSTPASKHFGSPRGPSSHAVGDAPGARTRFCFTTFARETLSPSKTPENSTDKSRVFLDLKAESAGIDEKLCQKYKLRGKVRQSSMRNGLVLLVVCSTF